MIRVADTTFWHNVFWFCRPILLDASHSGVQSRCVRNHWSLFSKRWRHRVCVLALMRGRTRALLTHCTAVKFCSSVTSYVTWCLISHLLKKFDFWQTIAVSVWVFCFENSLTEPSDETTTCKVCIEIGKKQNSYVLPMVWLLLFGNEMLFETLLS